MTDATLATFVLWSTRHEAWWRANGEGYTRTLREAGVYTQAEASEWVGGSLGVTHAYALREAFDQHGMPTRTQPGTVGALLDATTEGA